MKLKFIFSILLSMTGFAHGQGTFIYDQQSSDENNIQEGGRQIQQNQPMGQSFIPTLSDVGFVRLFIGNGLFGDDSATTIYVDILTGSITGTVLGQSTAVLIPGGTLFAGPVDFVFTNPIPVVAGTTYYFQPVASISNLILNASQHYNYSGGTAYANGAIDPNEDFWFREGIISVPEPSSALLVLLGSGVLLWRSRKRPFN
jgi:hypothetical protein